MRGPPPTELSKSFTSGVGGNNSLFAAQQVPKTTCPIHNAWRRYPAVLGGQRGEWLPLGFLSEMADLFLILISSFSATHKVCNPFLS
jgi:hypothetical protein